MFYFQLKIASHKQSLLQKDESIKGLQTKIDSLTRSKQDLVEQIFQLRKEFDSKVFIKLQKISEHAVIYFV